MVLLNPHQHGTRLLRALGYSVKPNETLLDSFIRGVARDEGVSLDDAREYIDMNEGAFGRIVNRLAMAE
jgi:hypothetical protein